MYQYLYLLALTLQNCFCLKFRKVHNTVESYSLGYSLGKLPFLIGTID